MKRVSDVPAETAVPELLHRLRNPLAALANGVQLVMHVATPTGEARELLQQMLGEIGRLDAATKETHRYFATGAGRPEAVDVSRAAAAALSAVREEASRRGVGVELDGRPGERAEIDAGRLAFALTELLANAVRASAPGGRVRLAWRRSGTDFERILVEDSGKGIPAEIADQIGRPYFTTSPERTGLGLATVARVCHRAGGSLRWENIAGGGCRFVLRVPAG